MNKQAYSGEHAFVYNFFFIIQMLIRLISINNNLLSLIVGKYDIYAILKKKNKTKIG